MNNHELVTNEVENALVEFGLTKTEARVYLSLLRGGPQTAYRVSKQAKLYKANTYQALDSLTTKGLVANSMINNKSILSAVPPEKFTSILELQKEKMQSVIPLMQRSFREESEAVSVFTGIDSLMNILYLFLNKDQPIYAFDIPEYVPDMVRIHISHFHKKRIKKKVKMYHIYDYEATQRVNFLKQMKYTYAQCSPQSRHSLTSTIVCGDTTLIVNWLKDIKIVQIVDSDIAETNKKQFHLLWKING